MIGKPEGLAVKRAALDDLGILVDLAMRQLTEHAVTLTSDQVSAGIRPVLADPERGLFLIAWREETPVGFAYLAFVWSLEHTGWASWLEELYVLPEHRQRGVGQGLLTAASDAARTRGCVAVDLEVDEVHQRAEHLYYRNGFVRLARTRWVKRLGTTEDWRGVD